MNALERCLPNDPIFKTHRKLAQLSATEAIGSRCLARETSHEG